MTITATKDTSRFEGKTVKARFAKIEDFAHEGKVRVALVRCCYCSKIHEHVVPEDVMQDAPLVRTARCKNGGSQDYSLVRAEDWVEEQPKGPRQYDRASYDGQDIGGLIVISDGPDRIAQLSGAKTKKIRQLWAKCRCGNIALIPASSVRKGVASCGCNRGRPTNRATEYEAWIKQN